MLVLHGMLAPSEGQALGGGGLREMRRGEGIALLLPYKMEAEIMAGICHCCKRGFIYFSLKEVV